MVLPKHQTKAFVELAGEKRPDGEVKKDHAGEPCEIDPSIISRVLKPNVGMA